MKNIILLPQLLLIFAFTGCSKDSSIKIDLENASFIHEIEDCTMDPLIEMNCTEWLNFENNTEECINRWG